MPEHNPGAVLRRVAPLLLGSGMCALIYQIAWFREFRLVFGASTAASAAVLAIFMGGIGVGGLLLGRLADRHPRPLLLYAILEAGIALFTLITPNLLALVRWLYIAIGGSTTLGQFGGTAVRLILAALVLAVPTLLMGGTLPAAARAVESDDDLGRRRVGLIYGVNTLGAVVGAILVSFFLLEIFGTALALRVACLINLLVAVVAYRAARLTPPSWPERPSVSKEMPAVTPRLSGAALFALIGAAVVGFAFFLMEVVWYRMLGPILGGTVFTFGLILAMALLGIGLGGAFYSAYIRHRPATLSGFAYTCLLEAAAIVLPFAIGDDLAILAGLLRTLGAVGFIGFVGAWAAITAIVVLPAAFIAGVQFPMLIALLGRGREQVGRQIGLVYLLNTIGAIVGSLAGGFGLIPLLSAPGCWRLVALLLAGLGIAAIVLSAREERQWLRLLVPAVTAGVVLMLSTSTGPTAGWRHGSIGAGRAPQWRDKNHVRRWKTAQRKTIQWEADGVESSVGLATAQGFSFIVNGKNDGNARLDAPTQVMLAMVGAILHPDPKTSAVIGLGTGSSGGWLAAIPSMERVDVMELEPAIVHIAEACTPVNHDALHNPKLNLIIGDARETLLTIDRKYDLIASEPSNPYRAGIASLFTRDYYEAVSGRLNEGGIFIQWVQAYEVDAETIHTIYATLGSVFENVETWQVGTTDLALVATHHRIKYDAAALRARMKMPGYREALLYAWRAIELEDMLGRYVAGPKLARAIADRGDHTINTDDENVIEFGFARTLGKNGLFSYQDVRASARKLGADKPDIKGEVDWSLVPDGQIGIAVGGMEAPQTVPGHWTEDQKTRSRAFTHWDDDRPVSALAEWKKQAKKPHAPHELAMVAEGMVMNGDMEALPVIEELRRYMPIEADALEAGLYSTKEDWDKAAAALERAFIAYRKDPWPLWPVMRRSLLNAQRIADKAPHMAARMEKLLSHRFAVANLDQYRAEVRVQISRELDGDGCVNALREWEPDVQWQQDFLKARVDCYRKAKHPLAERAEEELAEFLSAEPTPFAAGLD